MSDLEPRRGARRGDTAPRRFIDRHPESYSRAAWALRLVVRNLQWSRTQGVRRLLEEHEANPARRVAHTARRAHWRARHGVDRGTAVPVLLVGVPRSGTNMLARALKASPEFEVHNDGDAPAFHRYRLCSDEIVANLVARSRHRFVLLKPTLDSHRTLGPLQHLGAAAPARALWAYRDLDGRVRSALEKFGPGAAIGLSSVAAGTGSHLWLAQGLSSQSLALLRSVDCSRATPADGAAMVWLVRNRMFFEMGLDARDEVRTPAGVEDRDGVIVTGPVQTTGDAVGRFVGLRRAHGAAGRLHVSLLAARPSGEAPSCGAGTRLPLRSLIGARRRTALSTVGTPRVTAAPRRTNDGRPTRRTSRAVIRRHLGCPGDPATIMKRVHQ